jgi:glycosyltransferase involved in cell wall biosynthesis
VPKKDAAALAARMRALLDDPHKRRAEGDEGITRARTEFGEQRYLRELTAVYES